MLKNLRRPDWTTDSQQCHGCSLCRVRGRGHKNMSADTDINFGIFTEADLRISQRTIYTFLICINQILFGQPPPKSPRPTQKKFQFYNRPTVHARFQSVSPHQNTLQANCPPPCRCRTRSTGFPSESSSLDPFDTVALSRTHPTPSETTTHPMKRFKKRP